LFIYILKMSQFTQFRLSPFNNPKMHDLYARKNQIVLIKTSAT